jgi:hypothetical protein
MIFDQFLHDALMFVGESFFSQIPKKYIFFLSVVTPICVCADKIRHHVDKTGIHFFPRLPLLELFTHGLDHSLYEPVLDH